MANPSNEMAVYPPFSNGIIITLDDNDNDNESVIFTENFNDGTVFWGVITDEEESIMNYADSNDSDADQSASTSVVDIEIKSSSSSIVEKQPIQKSATTTTTTTLTKFDSLISDRSNEENHPQQQENIENEFNEEEKDQLECDLQIYCPRPSLSTRKNCRNSFNYLKRKHCLNLLINNRRNSIANKQQQQQQQQQQTNKIDQSTPNNNGNGNGQMTRKYILTGCQRKHIQYQNRRRSIKFGSKRPMKRVPPTPKWAIANLISSTPIMRMHE
ncbi:hypothetical protein HUG17_0130 [Dermatophagoides farinae]|uniref:Uncharacterized protein n=1 Tax=Dermatophagoides farinae TaxID=6954 RepID=A0A9D4P6E0_DERFA|nr:hypothetical protein HUG17_0130 [Dermatophagoides farinae]